MTTSTTSATATGIATPDTSRETYIGWDLNNGRNNSTCGWNKKYASRFRRTDSLYLKYEKHYQHLDQIDAGLKNGPAWWNQAYFNEWSNKDLIEILSSNLELLPHQQKQAKRYFLSQDLRKWGIRKELVAWAICAYILHSDETDNRRCHPQAETGEKVEVFWEVAYTLDFSMSERISTYCKVQSDMETPGSKRGKKDRVGGGI
jgi:hypothetical protein